MGDKWGSEWLHWGGESNISFGQEEEYASQPMQAYANGSIMQPNDLPTHPNLDCGAVSWQERAPSPRIPISFTEQNPILTPPSPVSFSDGFHGLTGSDEMLYSQTHGNAAGSVQPNTLWSHPHSVSWTFNQLLVTSSNSQTPGSIGDSPQSNELRGHQHLGQNHQELHKPLSKDQKYRLRLKAKEQEKDQQLASLISETQILKQQILRTNAELAHLRSENEMLKNNKDEQITRLISEIEMLRKEIASINYNNLFIH